MRTSAHHYGMQRSSFALKHTIAGLAYEIINETIGKSYHAFNFFRICLELVPLCADGDICTPLWYAKVLLCITSSRLSIISKLVMA